MIKTSVTSGNEAYEEIVRLNDSLNAEIASLKQYMQSPNMFSSSSGSTAGSDITSPDLETLRDQLRKEQQLVINLERDLQAKDDSLRNLEEELFLLRDLKQKKEEE